MAREQMSLIAAELLHLGYRVADVRQVMGGLLCVAKMTWPRKLPACD